MHQFTTSDGATLEYFDEGEGQPLVFIAGYRASAQTWLPTSRILQGPLPRDRHGTSLPMATLFHLHIIRPW